MYHSQSLLDQIEMVRMRIILDGSSEAMKVDVKDEFEEIPTDI